MLLSFLARLCSLCTLVFAVPATRNHNSSESSKQAVEISRAISVLPPLSRPSAPFLYRIHEDLPLYIRFNEFGGEVGRRDGDILM